MRVKTVDDQTENNISEKKKRYQKYYEAPCEMWKNVRGGTLKELPSNGKNMKKM